MIHGILKSRTKPWRRGLQYPCSSGLVSYVSGGGQPPVVKEIL